jgi:hypothetical protein
VQATPTLVGLVDEEEGPCHDEAVDEGSGHTERESVMPRTTKKKPMSKAAAAALKAMENMVIPTADGDVFEQLTEKLKAAGVGSEIVSIRYAGRTPSTNQVQVTTKLGDYGSIWPDWAYSVAEGAMHSNKKVVVIYNDQPTGSNLLNVLCTNIQV